MTVFLVPCPKAPSAPKRSVTKPALLSLFCSSTTQAPLDPTRRVLVAQLVAADAFGANIRSAATTAATASANDLRARDNTVMLMRCDIALPLLSGML